MRWRTLLPFALLCGCVLDGELKQELGTTPAALGDGWSVGNPTLAGLHPDSLAKVYRSLHSESRFLNALGLLIAVDGKLDLQVGKDAFYINAMLVKMDVSSLENLRYLQEEMKQKNVGGFTLVRSVNPTDLKNFISIFAKD